MEGEKEVEGEKVSYNTILAYFWAESECWRTFPASLVLSFGNSYLFLLIFACTVPYVSWLGFPFLWSMFYIPC